MKIVKYSASAISSYNFCIFQYYLNQILGLETVSGKAAIQGTIVHETLEIMARLNMHDKKYVDPMLIFDKKWDKHTKLNPHVEIRKETTRGEAADFKKCRESIKIVINDYDYNPNNMSKIIGVEKWFEFSHSGEEWKTSDGQLKSRGYIDLVREIDDKTIEIIDFKTGKRQDFTTFKEKDFWTLLEDVQPRVYHLAATQIWPQYENIIITFYYILDGGPISFCFNEMDTFKTIQKIRTFFEEVKNRKLIQRNRCWKCRFCSFDKNNFCDRIWSDFKIFGENYLEQHYKGLTFKEQQDLVDKGDIDDDARKN